VGLLRRRSTVAPSAAIPVDPELVQIGAAPARRRVKVSGQVTRIRTRPLSGIPSLAVTITDDTGSITAVWTGRRSLGGISLGRRLVIEGVGRQVGDRLEFTNPAYVLLA